jgi:hypothetical protein
VPGERLALLIYQIVVARVNLSHTATDAQVLILSAGFEGSPMNKASLFAQLAKEDLRTLLTLLSRAYDQLDDPQRVMVFEQFQQVSPPAAVEIDADTLIGEVESFRQRSVVGEYYAPFNMNSLNYMHIPAKTTAWFDG